MHLLISLIITCYGQVSGWEIFADTEFKWEYAEEFDSEIEIPVFSSNVKKLDGKEVTLTGHYLPLELEGERIIISKLPYASCFFCGGGADAGSVAEVAFRFPQKAFKLDELLTVKGMLRLNSDDYERLVFILEDATILQL